MSITLTKQKIRRGMLQAALFLSIEKMKLSDRPPNGSVDLALANLRIQRQFGSATSVRQTHFPPMKT